MPEESKFIRGAQLQNEYENMLLRRSDYALMIDRSERDLAALGGKDAGNEKALSLAGWIERAEAKLEAMDCEMKKFKTLHGLEG